MLTDAELLTVEATVADAIRVRFDSDDAFAAVVGRHVTALHAAGVRVVETEVRGVTRPDDRVAGFHLPPGVPGGGDRYGGVHGGRSCGP